MIAAPAAAPVERRTVELELAAPYEGWRFTARTDYPARVLADLASGDALRVIAAMDALITEHNFPATDGTVASSMLDVDPLDAVLQAWERYNTSRVKVPNE